MVAPYYLLVHFLGCFGCGPAGLRWPSVVASVVTVFIIGESLRLRWGAFAGLVGASALAANGQFLQTALTARSYALAAMLLALAVWAGERFTRAPSPHRMSVWALFASAAVLMQLFCALVLPVLAVQLLAARSLERGSQQRSHRVSHLKRRRPSFGTIGASNGTSSRARSEHQGALRDLAGFGAIPNPFRHVRYPASQRNDRALMGVLFLLPWVTAVIFLVLVKHQSGQVSWIERENLPKAFLDMRLDADIPHLGGVAALIAVAVGAQIMRRRFEFMWWVWLAAAILSPAALWVIGQVGQPVFFPRYAVFFVPAVSALMGASVGVCLRDVARISERMTVGAAILALLVGTEAPMAREVATSHAGFDTTSRFPAGLARMAHPGDTIALLAGPSQGGQFYGWAYYGGDQQFQHDLLEALPQGRLAQIAIRKVVSTHPWRTVAAPSAAGRTLIVSIAPVVPVVPGQENCVMKRLTYIEWDAVADWMCPVIYSR